MTPRQIVDCLTPRFGDAIAESHPFDMHPRIHVRRDAWRETAAYLKDAPDLRFDWLRSLAGVDYAADGTLCAVYELWSFDLRHDLAVKVFCPRPDPRLPSVADLWPTADWHEREAFDLVGIVFEGHPDLRRILCAEDWVGHPLRKDYIFPREYHGIPASVELDWQQDQ